LIYREWRGAAWFISGSSEQRRSKLPNQCYCDIFSKHWSFFDIFWESKFSNSYSYFL